MLSCSFLEVFIKRLVWTFHPLSVDFFFSFLLLSPSLCVSMMTISCSAALRMVLSHYSADTAISPNSLPLVWQDTLCSFKLASWSDRENQCIKIHRFSTTTSVYKNVLFPFAWKKLFLISFSKETAVEQKQQNSICLACFQAKLKSPWLNYKCERWDHCSFGRHSITVTVEWWDEFHIFDGKIKNIQYNPIGQKAFSAPSFVLLEVTLLTKPFSLFPSIFFRFASLHKVIYKTRHLDI